MTEKKKKPFGKIVIAVIVVLVIAAAAGSMGGNGSSSSSSDSAAPVKQEKKQEEQKQEEPYTISDEALDTSNPYGIKITGTLVNNTDEDKNYIQVEYNLYDADGAQIGTALANTNNLKAGGTWKFEAVSTKTPDEVANWERMDVTGF